MIKFEFSSENCNVDKFECATMSVTASLYLKDFPDEVSGDTDMMRILVLYHQISLFENVFDQ